MTTSVDAIIDRAVSIGNDRATQASQYAQTAIEASMGSVSLVAPQINTVIKVVEPKIPDQTDVMNQIYNPIAQGLMQKFADDLNTFFTTYFPLDRELMPAAEAWIKNAIVNGGSGINAAVEDQIWQRERERQTLAAASAADQAAAQWAAKGFPLPPGAAVAAVAQIQRDRDLQISDSSRTRAIESWKMEYENVKFAITQAIDYQVKAIAAAGEYLKLMALGPQLGAQLASTVANAQSMMTNAMASFFGSRIRLQEVLLEKDKTNAGLSMTTMSKQSDVWVAGIQNQTSAAVAVAQSLGQQASSALNAVNATAQNIVNS
jgi:hypothetical protein